MRKGGRAIAPLAVALMLVGARASAATITVSTFSDTVAADGACSLREALTNANANNQSGSIDCAAGAGADTIVFSADGTLTLTSALPALTDASATTIAGTGHAIVLHGNDNFRVFSVSAGAVVEVRDLTISHGRVTSIGGGGGGVDSAGALTITRCTLSSNDAAAGGNGGALRITGAGSLSLVDSTLTANTASSAAIMFLQTTGTIDIRGSAFISNRPTANCGLQLQSGAVTISNSTFFDNIVAGGYSGGAICSLGGTLTVTSSTFLGNFAATLNGGAIYAPSGTVTLRNTIIDGTGSSLSPCYGTIIDGGGNLESPGPNCNFTTAAGSFPSTPSSGLDTGPKNNGGPTQTIALLAGSAAIDRGNSTGCTAADQRGIKRPLDGDGDGTAACDIGAFEVLAKNGVACVEGSECASANCVDSVCCDTACGGGSKDCQACSVAAGASVSGTCGPVAEGTICVGGTCTAGVCTPPDAGPPDTGEVDTGATDAGSSPEVAPEDPAKPPVVAGNAGNAKSCTTSSECPSGFCVDHVCCNEQCDGPCRSCALPQAPGLCALQPLGYDLRNECSSDKPCYSTCANGACVPSFPGARCDNNHCTGPSTGRGAAVCSALAGQCLKDEAIDFDCAPYACAPAFGACLRDCVSTADCAPGNICDVAAKRCVSAGGGGDEGGCAYQRGSGYEFGLLIAALCVLGRARRRVVAEKR